MRLAPPPRHARGGRRAQLVLEAGGHQAIIRTLLFTANGRELVSVSDDKTIRVWSVSPDGRRATLARTMRGQSEPGRGGMLATAALSPPEATGQQRWLAVGGALAGSPSERAAVRLHDYASGAVQTLLQGHTDDVLAVAFAPGGRWLASAGKDGTIRLWDLTALQGTSLTRPPTRPDRAHGPYLHARLVADRATGWRPARMTTR